MASSLAQAKNFFYALIPNLTQTPDPQAKIHTGSFFLRWAEIALWAPAQKPINRFDPQVLLLQTASKI
jgi:hypothetical protein